MKKLPGVILLALLSVSVFSQNNRTFIRGTVTDRSTGSPLAGVVVSLGSKNSLTDEAGHFTFGKQHKGSYPCTINSLGYQSYTTTIPANDSVTDIAIQLIPSVFFLEPLEVKSVRAAELAPFAKTNLSKEEIAKSNLGQDIPFLLNQTPSTVVNSDAGNGVGYTAIHIRGTDATRINVTLNGIPYNDAESMITYFAISRSNTSSLPETNPPVSITLNCFPFQSVIPYWRSRVTPLTSSTMALRCSNILLKNVLFPTFGRPTIATVYPLIIISDLLISDV